jgi:hypothetical protein
VISREDEDKVPRRRGLRDRALERENHRSHGLTFFRCAVVDRILLTPHDTFPFSSQAKPLSEAQALHEGERGPW